MLTIREIQQPTTLEEAWQLNQKRTNKIIGGMLWLKMTRGNVLTAIDLAALGLNKIEAGETELAIGCMTTLRQLELSSELNIYTQGAAREAMRHIVGVQFRNLATVGGSVFGRFGFSDLLTFFLSLDTYVELFQAGRLPLSDFIERKYDRDVLSQVIVKKEGNLRCVYQSARLTRTDFPSLNCAASFSDAGFRLAIGARPGKAMLVPDSENILTVPFSQEKIAAFADYAARVVPTQSNTRGSALYRTHLVRVLTKRALAELFAPEVGREC